MSINIGYSFTRCAFFCFNVLFWVSSLSFRGLYLGLVWVMPRD